MLAEKITEEENKESRIIIKTQFSLKIGRNKNADCQRKRWRETHNEIKVH